MTALFSKEGRKRPDGNGTDPETVIGQSVIVEGTLKSQGNIVVHGEMKGALETTQQLTIGADARIHANVSAAHVFVHGRVDGNMRAEEMIELSRSARIYGDVKSQRITVESGAVLHGQCSIGSEGETDEARNASDTKALQSDIVVSAAPQADAIDTSAPAVSNPAPPDTTNETTQ